MTENEKYSLLKKIFWDATLSGKELLEILSGRKTNVLIDREMIFIRMIERLGWHEILNILGIDEVKRLLTKETISRLHQSELRERYEFIRSILSGEAVSFTGWGDEYYQKIKHTLFSDRWYRAQPTIL